ncbi:MAG TPA: hypothetical protein DDW50_05795 [Firmicutes bacterium]|jgi:DNA-binding IclR family transcriptional regulator|nr:hypothetical protein [Bacillota bacterium]
MITKAFKILECIADNPDNNTILTISRQTGIPKSTVHRILTILADAEVVGSKSRSGYFLTPKLLSLGFRGLGQKTMLDLAVPIMRNISELTKETISFHVISGTERICIYRVEGEYPISRNIKIGDRGSLLSGSVGKVMAAYMSQPELTKIIDIYLNAGKITPDQIPKLLEELGRVKESGYAVSLGERIAGTASLAVPILDISGSATATLSIATVMERMTLEEIQHYAQIMRDAVKQISF